MGKINPDFKGPTAYKSKKKQVIPNRRHWYILRKQDQPVTARRVFEATARTPEQEISRMKAMLWSRT